MTTILHILGTSREADYAYHRVNKLTVNDTTFIPWWPDRGTERLRELQPDVVLIDSDARRHGSSRVWAEVHAYLARPGTTIIDT